MFEPALGTHRVLMQATTNKTKQIRTTELQWSTPLSLFSSLEACKISIAAKGYIGMIVHSDEAAYLGTYTEL
jgi:hypothetical protein